MISYNEPKKIDKKNMNMIPVWEKATALVLCKEELFFQTNDGKTLDSIYPVADQAAGVIALFLDKPIMKA